MDPGRPDVWLRELCGFPADPGTLGLMRAAQHLIRLAVACAVAACLGSCGSTGEAQESADAADPWKDLRGTIPGSFSEVRYNLGFVEFWEVRGDWIDVQSPDGTAKQAIGEGPHKVIVQVSYEAVPRLHEVATGTVVGVSGTGLLIEDPLGEEALAPRS